MNLDTRALWFSLAIVGWLGPRAEGATLDSPGRDTVGEAEAPPDEADLPPATEWDGEQRLRLAAGEPVYTYVRDASGRQYGSSAVLVSAPSTEIWARVLDYDDYVAFLPYITSSQTVSQTVDEGGRVHVQATYALTTRGIVSHYQVDSVLDGERDLVAFTLVGVGVGPVASGSGWWRATSWEDGSGRVLLEYAVDLGLKWWVPGFVERAAADRGLPDLVRLMGVRAEKHATDGTTGSR